MYNHMHGEEPSLICHSVDVCHRFYIIKAQFGTACSPLTLALTSSRRFMTMLVSIFDQFFSNL